MVRPPRRTAAPVRALGIAMALSIAVLASACGGGDPPGDEAAPLTGAAAEGKALVAQRGCLACHTADGARAMGPTWKDLAGSTVTLADGTKVTADDEYLRRAILDPDAQIAKGYSAGVMRAAVPAGSISDAEADAIVAYLRTLSEKTADRG